MFNSLVSIFIVTLDNVIGRVAPDTELTGYPAIFFAGYPVSGRIVNIDFFMSKKSSPNLILISIFYLLYKMGSDFLDRQSLWYMFSVILFVFGF